MNIAAYPLEISQLALRYTFVSVGPKGEVAKEIRFSETTVPGIINLGFGDVDTNTGQLNDAAVTNNQDTEMVLSTVVKALRIFFDHYPAVLVFAKGVDQRRTRLYQMGISRYHQEAFVEFEIFGQTQNGWEPFKKDKEYLAFLVRRR